MRKLRKTDVDRLRWNPNGPSVQVLWDCDPVGLGVRVHPSGRKAYVCRYRATRGRAGRKRLLVLGPANVLTLDQARDDARKMLARVLHGEDPAETRERERSAITFGQLADRYLDEQGAEKRSAKADRQRVRDYLRPAFGTKLAVSVSRADLAALHTRLADQHSGPTANRALALASVMFNWGERVGALPAGHVSPAKGIPRYRERSRERFLSKDEMRRVLKAVDAHPNVYFKAAILLFLETGLRRSELLSARWRDVDLEAGTLRVPRTKQGGAHEVPLTEVAVAVLKGLPREQDNPHVLPGTKRGSHLAGIDKMWADIRKAANVEDVWIHDLRRTVGSWMTQQGASIALVGAVLGHRNISTTAVYARVADDHQRAALEQHSRAVAAARDTRAEDDSR